VGILLLVCTWPDGYPEVRSAVSAKSHYFVDWAHELLVPKRREGSEVEVEGLVEVLLLHVYCNMSEPHGLEYGGQHEGVRNRVTIIFAVIV
jgi:hypothetical protein